MTFALTADHQMLQDSVRRLVRQDYTPEQRRQRIHRQASCDPQLWHQFAELGWLALPVPEHDGGLGEGALATAVLMQGLGEGLVVEPYLATVVLGGSLLRHAPDDLRLPLMARLVSGDLQLATALDEYEQRHDPALTRCRAVADGQDILLSGRKSMVLNGEQADWLFVLARSHGEPGDHDGLDLFLLPAESTGLSRRGHRTVDGGRAAEISLEQVRVPASARLGRPGRAIDLLDRALAPALLALCAEADGILGQLVSQTVEYARTRKQFGVAIGSFQALQHRLADMYMQREQFQSLCLAAHLQADAGHPDARRTLHAVKAQVGIAARRIGQEAIQLHGGMGMTDELIIGHYVKRLTAIEALFGSSEQHLLAMQRNQRF